MRIKIHKHTNRCGFGYGSFGKEIRDLGDYWLTIWKFEFKLWMRKPYYSHLPISDNGEQL